MDASVDGCSSPRKRRRNSRARSRCGSAVVYSPSFQYVSPRVARMDASTSGLSSKRPPAADASSIRFAASSRTSRIRTSLPRPASADGATAARRSSFRKSLTACAISACILASSSRRLARVRLSEASCVFSSASRRCSASLSAKPIETPVAATSATATTAPASTPVRLRRMNLLIRYVALGGLAITGSWFR